MGIHHSTLGKLGHMSIFKKSSDTDDIDLVGFEVTEEESYNIGGKVCTLLCML